MVERFKDNLSKEELLALCIRQIEHHDEDVHKAMQILRQSHLDSKHQFEKWYKDNRMAGRTKSVRHTCPGPSKRGGEVRCFAPKGTQGRG